MFLFAQFRYCFQEIRLSLFHLNNELSMAIMVNGFSFFYVDLIVTGESRRSVEELSHQKRKNTFLKNGVTGSWRAFTTGSRRVPHRFALLAKSGNNP